MPHDLTAEPAHAQPHGEPIFVGDQRLIVATAAETADVATLDDWDIAADAVAAPDRAYLVGRYCHGGLPSNRNGHIFRTEELPGAIRYVAHTPLDMLHDPKRIIGTHIGARMVYPPGVPQARVSTSTNAYVDTAYVKVLASVWSYHYPEAAAEIAKAHEAGNAFLSMSCLPETVECNHPGCDHTAPWQGYTSSGYCAHMQGVNDKWFNNPLFLGGAIIIPPVRPGWKDASITQVAPFMRANPGATEELFDQVSAAAPGSEQLDLESITAQLLALAYHDDPAIRARASVVAPGWRPSDGYEHLDLTPPDDVATAIETTGRLTAAQVEHLVNLTLDEHPSVDDPAVAEWAAAAWTKIVVADLAAMAADVSTSQRQRWADDGVALPDGSFPIPNLEYLRKALLAFGRASNKAAAKRHILKRARALNAPDNLLERAQGLGAAAAAIEIAQAAGQTGVIVAVVPPKEIREQIAAVGDEPVDEIHMTLAFMGKVLDDDDESPSSFAMLGDGSPSTSIEQLAGAVAGWAVSEKPLMATTSGRGVFDQGDEEVTYVSVDAPGLGDLRTRLVAALERANIRYSNLHGFTPHITAQYHPPGAGPTQVPTGLSWQITEVEIWWAGQKTTVPLG